MVNFSSTEIIVGILVIIATIFFIGYFSASPADSDSSSNSDTSFGILVGLFAGAGVLGLGILTAL